MRKKGLNLLPSRRKRGAAGEFQEIDRNEEILEIDQRHQRRLRLVGQALLLWAKRAIGVAITVAIFYYILRPIHRQWPLVRTQVLKISPLAFMTATGMFAIFLLTFRVLVWRKILAGFGHNLPVAPATRIWSTSELARYLPIPVLQVVGRIYLLRPYGVSSAICSVSQLLELAVFLLANLIVAVVCLGIYGFKHMEGSAWWWLVTAVILLPLLLTLLHTRVFYGITNGVLSRMGKPGIVQRVRRAALPGFLAWNIFGLLWQTLALYVLMREPLSLKIDWLWALAGAYCLAWCAGFLAFWAPAGLGIRELVFIGVVKLIAPLDMQAMDGFGALVAFLSIVSRFWTVAGEVILVTLAYALDLRGALGRPDAPGRIATTPSDNKTKV